MDSLRNYYTIPKVQIIRSYKQFRSNHLFNKSLPSGFDELQVLKTPDEKINKFVGQFNFGFNRVAEDGDNSVYFTNKLGLYKITGNQTDVKFLGYFGNNFDIDFLGNDTLLITCWGSTVLVPRINTLNSEFLERNYFSLKEINDSIARGNPLDVNRLAKNGKQFWYATMFSGLWMSERMKLVHFNKSDTTISNNLNDICFDEKGHVIFGSNTGEICIATYSQQKLKIDYRITSEQGLHGNSISWLVADQKGKLWAGTNLGLNCIDLDSLYQSNKYTIRFLDEEDGYTGQSSKKAVMDKNGILWIGAGDQLVRFDTKRYLSNRIKPGKIIMKSIEVNHFPIDSILNDGLDRWTTLPASRFTLGYSENNLAFSFDILNYNNPAKDRFRYKLQGYDKTWSKWSESRKAIYTNLPPGKYSFSVESENINTHGKAVALNLEFRIRRPWWKLWYLQTLMLVSLLSVAVLATRKFTAAEREKQLKKAEIETKIAQLEMQALQAQMNPHFIFNCVNGIQYYVLANKLDEVLAYLSDFSKVVRGSLTNATLHRIPLEEEINFLHSYLRLEQMRFPEKFDYSIRCFDSNDVGAAFLPPMLLQPFVENAIRHGFMNLKKKGKLSIVFEKAAKDVLKCTITDNGIGREKARLQNGEAKDNDRQHSGMITETRIRLFNSNGTSDQYKIVYTDLSKNGKPCGLQVELYVPMEMGNG
jgi:hypothetical protein